MGMFNSSKHGNFNKLSANVFTNNHHTAETLQDYPSYLPKPHTHENQEGKKSTQTWIFEVPLVATHFTTPKMLSFHDLVQKWAPKGEALCGASMVNEEEENGNVREREGCLKFSVLLSEEREKLFGLK